MRVLNQQATNQIKHFIDNDGVLPEHHGKYLLTVAKCLPTNSNQLKTQLKAFVDNYAQTHSIKINEQVYKSVLTNLDNLYSRSGAPKNIEIDFAVYRWDGNYYVQLDLGIEYYSNSYRLTLIKNRVIKSVARSITKSMYETHLKLKSPNSQKTKSAEELKIKSVYNVMEIESQLKLANSKLTEYNALLAEQVVNVKSLTEQLAKAKQITSSVEITYSNMEEQLKLIKEREAKYGVKYKLYDVYNKMIELEILGKGFNLEGKERIFTTRGRSSKIIAIVK